MPIRAVCFDLFNTLVSVGSVPETVGAFTADILGIDHEVWRQACFGEHHDICGPSDALENMRRMAHAIDPTIPETTLVQAVAHRQQRFDYALQNVEQDVLDGLRSLQQTGIPMALVSNASTSEVRAWPGSPLSPLFHSALFSCECGEKKPEQGIYQLALKKLGVNARECLFVGDGGSDEHQGAHASGMLPVLITRHLNDKRQKKLMMKLDSMLHARVSSVTEVIALVRQGGGEINSGRDLSPDHGVTT